MIHLFFGVVYQLRIEQTPLSLILDETMHIATVDPYRFEYLSEQGFVSVLSCDTHYKVLIDSWQSLESLKRKFGNVKK